MRKSLEGASLDGGILICRSTSQYHRFEQNILKQLFFVTFLALFAATLFFKDCFSDSVTRENISVQIIKGKVKIFGIVTENGN